MSDQTRWNARYQNEEDQAFSWTEGAGSLSQAWILENFNRDAFIADIGAGRSPLIGCLREQGFRHLAHIEWSEAASNDMQRRLGGAGDSIQWFIGDVCDWTPKRPVDLWHDRAVFHFQVDSADKKQYLAALDRAVAPAGFVLLATFHLNGPEKCSGFPVCRYDESGLIETLLQFTSSTWQSVRACVHPHTTPAGAVQWFQYVLAQKV